MGSSCWMRLEGNRVTFGMRVGSEPTKRARLAAARRSVATVLAEHGGARDIPFKDSLTALLTLSVAKAEIRRLTPKEARP